MFGGMNDGRREEEGISRSEIFDKWPAHISYMC